METDKTTIADLSIFDSEEGISIFEKLDFTRTTSGKETLRKILSSPQKSIQSIQSVQSVIEFISHDANNWPQTITNGTMMVIEQFLENVIETLPRNSNKLNSFLYKIFHPSDFSLIKYSLEHCCNFIRGMKSITVFGEHRQKPEHLKEMEIAINELLQNELFTIVYKKEYKYFSTKEIIALAQFIKYKFKNQIRTLLAQHAKLDAWHSLATAVHTYNLVFPEFEENTQPILVAEALHHLLLQQPVPYDISLNHQHNFLFLTGANMAGKSTFIKSIGVAVYLAHTGMAVPAKKFRLTYFDGLVSNINVADNLVKGESYFYNEVQRIKATIQKINDGKKWMILIDELFKGTNVEDAMKCSVTVIEGLQKMHHSIFILSTHLYEIGEQLKTKNNIVFYYFKTSVENERLHFTYRLHPGISNDRLGYLILKQEGVLQLLQSIK